MNHNQPIQPDNHFNGFFNATGMTGPYAGNSEYMQANMNIGPQIANVVNAGNFSTSINGKNQGNIHIKCRTTRIAL
jgi:hypothetical protein